MLTLTPAEKKEIAEALDALRSALHEAFRPILDPVCKCLNRLLTREKDARCEK